MSQVTTTPTASRSGRDWLFLFGFVFFLCGGFGLFLIHNYAEQKSEVLREYARQASNFELAFHKTLAMRFDTLSLAMDVLLNDDNTIKTFKARDRDALAALTVPLFKTKLLPLYGIEQFQFHLAPATSFLRVHNPSKFGDDISSFRQTLTQANEEKKPVLGLEIGYAGPGLRLVVPIIVEGEHLGSVEFGESLTVTLDSAVKMENLEYAIAIRADIFERFKRLPEPSTDVVQDNLVFYAFSSQTARSWLEKLPNVRPSAPRHRMHDTLRVANKHFMLSSFPLVDYSGKELGQISLLKEATDIMSELETTLLLQGSVGGVLFILLGLLGFGRLRRLRDHVHLVLSRHQREIQDKTDAYNALLNHFTDFKQLKRGYIAELSYAMTAPLRGFQGHLQQFLGHCQRTPSAPGLDKLLQAGQQVRYDSERLTQLLDEFRVLEQLKQGVLEWEETPFDAQQLPALLRQEYPALFVGRLDVRVKVEVAPELGLLSLPAREFHKILAGLMRYATQNTRFGHVHLGVNVDASRHLSFTVSYTGKTFSPAEVERLLDASRRFQEGLHEGSGAAPDALDFCLAHALASHYRGQFELYNSISAIPLPCICLSLPVLVLSPESGGRP